MLDRTALIYRYDGTQDGLLCCVYEAMAKREQPMMILSAREMQSMLFEDRFIETDPAVARRVADAIRGRISEDALTMVGRALLTHLPGKEIHLLDVLRRAFREGPGLLSNLSDPAVYKLNRAITFLEREAHLLTGFIRFRESDGVLTAVIEPKTQVLKLLAPHFTDRFRQETFLI
ncbi:MAG: TIGR03915 family putative DNA repair protein, partial [Eubacteriales bacterium]|nr:TIGR03915 family putative DNA repair protein [Eubacteriales bacterium]